MKKWESILSSWLRRYLHIKTENRQRMLSSVVIGNPAAIGETIKCISHLGADEVTVLSTIDNISKGIDYFENHPQPDIIFCSPLLGEGVAFTILDHSNNYTPIVFMGDDTGFLKKALEYNCIAYLLSPVDPSTLQRTLAKYRMLYSYYSSVMSKQNPLRSKHERTRMIVRNGKENIALPISDVVLVHTLHRSVFVIDHHGTEYTTDKTLSEIETGLDKEKFFRVNRHCIVNINFVHGFKTFERVKLLVELTVPGLKHNVIVSQDMAREFREWMYNA
jgi:DNA-binding LytR/AlgR family response regulator